MPRAKRGSTARGSRNTGIVSGATLALTPSGGVTISLSGLEYSSGSFVTPTEVGYMASVAGNVISQAATAAIQMVHGLMDYANAPGAVPGYCKIDTGLTAIITAFCNLYAADSLALSSSITTPMIYWSGSEVTVGLFAHGGYIGATAQNGVSIAWTAFGT